MSKSINQLIAGFFDNDLNEREYRELYEGIRNKRHIPSVYEKKVKIPDGEVHHISLTNTGGSIYFESGVQLTMHKNGFMTMEYGGGEVEVDASVFLKIPVNYLAQVYEHVIKLHRLDHAISLSEASARKHRFVHTGNKKAFMAGMITGRVTKL